MRADAIGFLAAPDVIAHPGPLRRRTDAFAPFVIAAEQSAEAQHTGREIGRGFEEIFSPIVPIIIPGCFDGWIGRTKRLHELHVEVRRDVEEWGGIDKNLPTGAGGRFSLGLRER